MKKVAAFSRLQKIACATCLLLFLCSCKAGQPRAVSSKAPAGLSEADRNALVEKFMPPPDRWQESYAALPEEQQNEVQDWLVWYAARSDEDKKMLSYRPWGFGCFSEADVAAVMAEQDEAVLQTVETYSGGQAQLWWSQFCSLPEHDPKSSQTAALAALRDFAALSPEEQALASSLPVAPPEVYDEKELPEKLKNIDPGVVKALEEHVFSPAAWWQHYFDQPDTSDSGLESREQIMSWLLWYKGLSPEDQSRTDQRTHLFFADWEF